MSATIPMDSVSLEAASVIIDRALAKGRAMNFKPLAVAVLDPRGCLKAYEAEDGSSLLRFDIAFGKAWGVLGMGFGGRELERRGNAYGIFFNSLQVMSEGKVVPAQGGVLIRNQAGQVVGAVGVSGDSSDKDELCAIEGITAAGLVPDTGDPS
ncbi:MAG TPA: heme-binding protein [Dongiaceae bacterium]|nr:heme-binding protein [Dongiaceae bacterium]